MIVQPLAAKASSAIIDRQQGNKTTDGEREGKGPQRTVSTPNSFVSLKASPMVARGRSQSWSGEWLMDTSVGANQLQAKLVLLGDMGAGKSSLVMRFVQGQYLDYQDATVGAAFVSQSLAVNETTVKFEIWDTAGQERYHSLAPMYYRGASAAIVVYDMTNADSFAQAKKWVSELQRIGNPNLVIALAGNKADLARRRKVEPEEGQAYADEYALFFMETSAKTSLNVNELFHAIAKKLPKEQAPMQEGIVLTHMQAHMDSKSGTCCT